MNDVVDCPAEAGARMIWRLETDAAATARLIAGLDAARSPAKLEELHQIWLNLLCAADDARAQLAEVDPTSEAGALAQLLAAIHDIRVGDTAEVRRAKVLEERAVRFLGRTRRLTADFANALSQTRRDEIQPLKACTRAEAYVPTGPSSYGPIDRASYEARP